MKKKNKIESKSENHNFLKKEIKLKLTSVSLVVHRLLRRTGKTAQCTTHNVLVQSLNQLIILDFQMFYLDSY